VRLCIAVDVSGKVLSSTHPTRGAHAWRVVRDRRLGGVTGLSCPSRSLCVAVDNSGYVHTSRNPAGGARSWKEARVDYTVNDLHDVANIDLLGVSCPSTSLCVAVDGYGNALFTHNPAGGARSWKRVRAVSPHLLGLYGVSCRSVSLCVALDGVDVFSSIHPTGSAATWRRARVEASLSAVACASTALCVAFDDSGNVLLGERPRSASAP
jgi:hypothetical protein